jgi:site-specific DNA-methyltransferase (adenine-specific)
MAIACQDTGRHFIGIEKEPQYVEIARRRLAEAAAQPRLELTA